MKAPDDSVVVARAPVAVGKVRAYLERWLPDVPYVKVDPKDSFAAVGFFQPEPAALGAFRMVLSTTPTGGSKA